MAYYLKNKAKINDQALNRYYKKRYPQGKPELFYSENIAKLFNITKVEANVLAKLLGVPKNFGRYFWSKRYINMIHWIIRFKEVNK